VGGGGVLDSARRLHASCGKRVQMDVRFRKGGGGMLGVKDFLLIGKQCLKSNNYKALPRFL
jgi:hypothetical protein